MKLPQRPYLFYCIVAFLKYALSWSNHEETSDKPYLATFYKITGQEEDKRERPGTIMGGGAGDSVAEVIFFFNDANTWAYSYDDEEQLCLWLSVTPPPFLRLALYSELSGSLSSFLQNLPSTLSLSLSRFWLSVTPWTKASTRLLLSMECFRLEYWSVLPFPPPGDLPNSGNKPASLASPALAGGSLPLAPLRKPSINYTISHLHFHIPSLLHTCLYFKKIYSLLSLLIYSHFPFLYYKLLLCLFAFCLLLVAPGSWWDLCSPALSNEKHQVLTTGMPGNFLFSSLLEIVHMLTASNKLPLPSFYWNCSLENTKNQNATNQAFSWSLWSPSLQPSSIDSLLWFERKKSEKAAFLVDQMVKNLPGMQETPVQSSDPLLWFTIYEYVPGWFPHSSGQFLWTKEPGGVESMGSQRVGHDWATSTFSRTCFIFRVGFLGLQGARTLFFCHIGAKLAHSRLLVFLE